LRGSFRPAKDLSTEPGHGIKVSIDDTFFERNNRVIGNLDVFGADFSAALGDVAHPKTRFVSNEVSSIVGV